MQECGVFNESNSRVSDCRTWSAGSTNNNNEFNVRSDKMTTQEKMAVRDILKSLAKDELIKMNIKGLLNLQIQIMNEENPVNLKNQMAMIGIAVELNKIQAAHPKEFKSLEKEADKNWEMWYEINQQFTSLKGAV